MPHGGLTLLWRSNHSPFALQTSGIPNQVVWAINSGCTKPRARIPATGALRVPNHVPTLNQLAVKSFHNIHQYKHHPDSPPSRNNPPTSLQHSYLQASHLVTSLLSPTFPTLLTHLFPLPVPACHLTLLFPTFPTLLPHLSPPPFPPCYLTSLPHLSPPCYLTPLSPIGPTLPLRPTLPTSPLSQSFTPCHPSTFPNLPPHHTPTFPLCPPHRPPTFPSFAADYLPTFSARYPHAPGFNRSNPHHQK